MNSITTHLFVCLFVYIYLFTPNLEKVCECNWRWLRKGPRSLLIGWDFLDQNHDGLTTGSARYEAVLSIGSNRTNTCKITLWSKYWKDTDTHTTTHKLTKSGFCNTKKRTRIILWKSQFCSTKMTSMDYVFTHSAQFLTGFVKIVIISLSWSRCSWSSI